MRQVVADILAEDLLRAARWVRPVSHGFPAPVCIDGSPRGVQLPARCASSASRASSAARVERLADDGAQDVGPASEDAPVILEGVIASTGPLRVTVHAATPDEAGYTWTFQVVPDPVPVALPTIEADIVPDARPEWWPFGRR